MLAAAGGILTSSYLFYRCFIHQHHWHLPGPSQSLITGDLKDFRRHGYQLHLLLDEYVKSFGDCFTFSHQGNQLVVVTDKELIQKILVKEHESFENRKFFISMPWPCHQMITMATSPKAKLVRSLVKAVLNAESVRNSWMHFKDGILTLGDILQEKSLKGMEVDSTSLADGYVMQILLKMAFSLDYPNQSQNNKLFVTLSKNFVQSPNWINEIAALPLVRYMIKYIPSGYKRHLKPFIQTAVDLVKARRNKHNMDEQEDILDVLLKAQSENNEVLDEDLIAQAIVLLTAVHAATSTTIAIATYYIAKHTDIQKRLQEEIDDISYENGSPSYDDIHGKLKYLDQVINEVLRLHPPGFMIMRECTKAIEIDKLSFSKGDGVLIPTYSIQRDSRFYDNPDQFKPDRKERAPFMSFGGGYRMCPGKLLALSEIKMYFAYILKNYDLKLVNEDQALDVKSYVTVQAMLVVNDPIKMRVEQRSKKPETH